MSWVERAACAGKTALMFDVDREAEARVLCAGCPVIASCGSAAVSFELVRDDVHGFRAGRSQGERRDAIRLLPVSDRLARVRESRRRLREEADGKWMTAYEGRWAKRGLHLAEMVEDWHADPGDRISIDILKARYGIAQPKAQALRDLLREAS